MPSPSLFAANLTTQAARNVRGRVNRKGVIPVGRRIQPNALAASIALALLAATGSVHALSLAEAYTAALGHDPQFRAAQAQNEAGREALPQAVARLRPNISLSSQRYRIEQERTDGGQQFPKQDYPSYSTVLSIRQPLLNLRLVANRDQAKATVASGSAALTLEQQQLANRLVTAYSNLALGYEQLAVVELQQRSNAARLTAARRALEAGTGIRTDINEIQAQTDLLEAQQLQVKQSIQAAQAELEEITGQPVTKPIRLQDNKALLQASQRLDPGALGNWLEKINTVNPELLARRAQVEAAQAASRASRADHLPTLELIAQTSKSSSENSFFVDSKTETQAIGVQLNLPLYQGGFLQSRDRQTAAELRAAEELVSRTQTTARIEASKAFYALKEGIARVAALEKAVKSANQVVVANQKSFTAGLRSTLDILTAEQRAAQTQLELRQAQLQLLVNHVRLLGLVAQVDAPVFEELSSWFQ
jgi:protease secretion system outer membrane protein